MLGSVSGGNAQVLMVAFLNEATARQRLAVDLVKKAQDMEKVQGAAALQLIEVAGSVSGISKIDVYV